MLRQSAKAAVRTIHIHEVEGGSRRTIKLVFIMRGRVLESALDDSGVLARLNFNGDPHKIHQYTIDISDDAGGSGLLSSRDHITKAIMTSKYAAEVANLLRKENLEEDDIKHTYISHSGISLKAYVGMWKVSSAARTGLPQDCHVPNSIVPIGSGQVYAPAVLCCFADGNLIDYSEASSFLEGKMVDAYFKFELAVGWSKQDCRKFLYINAKPLGVRLLPDTEGDQSSSSAVTPPASMYEGAFI